MGMAGQKGFEGWYFKHQKGDDMVAFIPGQAESGAFVQVISQAAARHQRRDRLRAIFVSQLGYHGTIPLFPHGVPPRRSQYGAHSPGQCHAGRTHAQLRRRSGLCGKRQRHLFPPLLPVDAVQRFSEAMLPYGLDRPHSVLRRFLLRLHLRHPVPEQRIPFRNLQRR